MTSSLIPPIYSAQFVKLVHYTTERFAHVHIYKFFIYCLIADFSHIVSCDGMSFLYPGALEVVNASVVVPCKVLNGVKCSMFPYDHIYMFIDILHAYLF